MNEIVNIFLLAGEKFMLEMHLRQSWSKYSTFGPFTKNKKTIQKFEKTVDSRYIYQNEPDKACFQYNMAYGDFKEQLLIKFWTIKHLILIKIKKYDGYQKILASMVYKFFDKKLLAVVFKNISNKEFSEVLHKLFIRKFKKRKVQSPFMTIFEY